MEYSVWYEGVCEPSRLVEAFPSAEAAMEAADRMNQERRAKAAKDGVRTHSIFGVRVRSGEEWVIPEDDDSPATPAPANLEAGP